LRTFSSFRAWLLVVVHVMSAAAAEPPFTAVAFAPDGHSAVIGSQSGLEVRQWPGLEKLRSIPTDLRNVHDLVFSPRGDLLAVAGGTPGEFGAVELIRWPQGDRKQVVESHDDLVYAVAWRADSRAWVSASLDHTLQIHEGGNEPARNLEGHSRGVLAVVYLTDGRTLVSGGVDHSLRVWDAESGRSIRQLDNHTGAVLGLALRPGQPPDAMPMVASIGTDLTVRFWEPTRGRMVRFARVPSSPLALAWSPDGRTLAVACRDGHVRLVDANTVAFSSDLSVLEGPAFGVAAAPDGTSILVCGARRQLRRIDTNWTKKDPRRL
jgi:WD40 repeat protein